ncbi:hypothetical protein [Actinomadura sp. SCN-SB]|uniref:hypothetical protein n=1 Tax=Actinomadura sp. SCN-SB TaxID=3373092 RepID=UPI00375041E8
MNTATKLGAYALGLAAVFGGAFGVGEIAGPVGATTETAKHSAGGHATTEQAGGNAGGGASTAVPGGLQVSQDGYTLSPKTTTIEPGKRTDFRFTVDGPDGKPVTRYTLLHGKKLHLIIARRDLSGFQHVHPTEAGGGVWTIPLTLGDPGAYRFFADVQPEGVKKQLTLGTDVTAPGEYRPRALPKAEQVAKVDGYEVRLDGQLVPGRSSKVTLTVSKDGRPVTNLEPYLEAYGHLVALRDRDLAYLHVHPDGEPGDGKTKPGPSISFFVEAPSSGAYRLYLDFQHEGKVRTAEFTALAGGAVQPSQEPSKAEDDHGEHPH